MVGNENATFVTYGTCKIEFLLYENGRKANDVSL